MNDSGLEVMVFISEELDSLEDISVGFSNNLLSQIFRKFRKKLLRFLIFLLESAILNVLLDSVVESIGKLRVFRELFKRFKLFLDFFIVSIVGLDKRGHVTNNIGVEAYSEDHPEYINGLLNLVTRAYITKSDCGQRLKSPMQSYLILVSGTLI